jgi:hypothetical protein
MLLEADHPLTLKNMLAEIACGESRPVDCAAILKLLQSSPFAAEIEKDLWCSASGLINGRIFFAIPETSDVAQGRICFIGSDLYFLMRLAVAQGKAEFVTEDGNVIPVTIGFEDIGYFYANGLGRWYAQENFAAEHDFMLFTVLDYSACRYAIRRFSEDELDGYISRNTRVRVCNWLMAFLQRKSARFPDSQAGGFSISGALSYLLYHKPALFTDFPCNLSFCMSLDERFFITGKQFFLRSEAENPDFTEHYFGGDNGMLLEPQDVGKFNRALEALFGIGDAGQAMTLFTELSRDYPEEWLLHKYIYQAAWQMEDFEAVRLHASIYRRVYARDPDPLCTLIEVALIDEEYDKAMQYLMIVDELVHPDDIRTKADISSARMRVYWESGDIGLAVFEARRLLALEPDNEDALALLEETPLGESIGQKDKLAHIITADFTNKAGERDDS